MTNTVFINALLVCVIQTGSAFFCGDACGQNTSEIGFGLGATNYRGEISPGYQFENNRPALTAFYRKDISVPLTLKGGITTGFLRAADENVMGVTGLTAPLQLFRQANTRGGIVEAAGTMEYNFLNYRSKVNKIHFTPYLFVGIGFFYANTTTVSTNAALTSTFNRQGSTFGVAIPAGVGFKYALSEHLNLGLEVGARKAFTDQLDHLGEQDPLFVNPHDQDWYYYSGVSLSYTFYKIPCPDSYKNNKKLLK